jgi:phosphatidylglycerophosphatase A
LAAFLLFRLADIFKPGPIGALDRNLHSGLGIMADDMLAGALTALALALAALALA